MSLIPVSDKYLYGCTRIISPAVERRIEVD